MTAVSAVAALLGWVELCWAEPRVTIRATVDPDLEVVHGELRAEGLEGAVWVDPLASLPIPEGEVPRIRTYPGLPERGEVTWQQEGDVFVFRAELPFRWGDTGHSAHGLFANGGWYPQPLIDARLPEISWDVTVEAPSGALAALGDEVGTTPRWQGVADRASLAVVPDGQVSVVEGEGFRVRLVTGGRPRRALLRNLREQLPLTVVSGRRWQGLVVEAPLRRRLSRIGAGLAYVSDRAWRTFPWFHRLHHTGALRGLLGAWAGVPDAFHRRIAAASLTRLYAARKAGERRVDLVGLTRWIPIIDNALYSNEMDFRSELFDEVVPSDLVLDELAERLDPTAPGTLVVRQLADRFGDDAADEMARLIAVGWPVPEAAARAGVPPAWLEDWRRPYPEQDYLLALSNQQITVTRDAPPDAPPEVLQLALDGEVVTLRFPEGPSQQTLTVEERPDRVRLDPEGHVAQVDRLGDVRPSPLRWTLWAQISDFNINATTQFVTALGALSIRQRADTRNALRIWAWTTQRYWLGGRLSYTRYAGPLVRPTIRAHAVSLGLEAGWLNPNFGDTPGADYTISGALSYQWDDRPSLIFPRNGTRVFAGLQAGGAPQTRQSFVRVRTEISGERAPHPRHVVAGRFVGGVAATEIPQERLDFGGVLGVRGIPDQAVQTNVQALLNLEYRPVIVADAWWSVLGLAWVRDLFLVTGVDLGVGRAGDQQLGAVGIVGGVGATVEMVGVTPGSVLVFASAPVWFDGFAVDDQDFPVQFYFSWGVDF